MGLALTYEGKVLSDLVKLRNENIKDNQDPSLIYLSTANMKPEKNGINLEDDDSVEKSGKKFYKGDVLISNIRPYFKKIWKADREGIASADILNFIPINESSVDKTYLYYLLSTDRFFNYMTATAKGTKMPRGDKKAIKKFEVPSFTMKEQKQIANILSSFDDKIENNNAIIANLEEQAQAIFKSWFVDFEPFQDEEFIDSELGKIPEEWEVISLDDMASYKNGLAMQKYRPENDEDSLPVLKIKELRANRTDLSSDRCSKEIPEEVLVNNGDVVFSWSGSLLVEIWTGGQAGLNQHLFKVTSEEYHKWFYYYWTKFFLNQFVTIARDRATTMGHIKRSHLKEAKILIPKEEVLEKMNKIMDPIVELLINLGIQNKKLEETRDTLLPKLMSGEIRVEEAVEAK